MIVRRRVAPFCWIAILLVAVGCAAGVASKNGQAGVAAWTSRAIPEARGDIRTLADGRRVAVRYAGWTQRDFAGFRTYAYDDQLRELPVERGVMPAGLKGDPVNGRKIFMSRTIGPCTGCHLIPGDDVWPAGNVGPDLSSIGSRGLTDEHLYMQIYDARIIIPNTSMPPWGRAGVLKPAEISDVVAFLQTLKGQQPAEKDPDRNPFTRRKPIGFGDNLDPTNNPAVLLAESAEAKWAEKGPAGRACADCHANGPATAMKGVAVRYPKIVPAYGRVMSIEDFLSVHAAETTGRAMPEESVENLTMTVLIKMASNGMPVAIDTSSAAARAALARGKASFERRVGERNHACADCHTTDKGADKFLGGRLLANLNAGLTRHFPTWRTSQNEIWDMRKRVQWCMTPLGANMLAADSVEYAELEMYLTSFDVGKPLSVPGIRH